MMQVFNNKIVSKNVGIYFNYHNHLDKHVKKNIIKYTASTKSFLCIYCVGFQKVWHGMVCFLRIFINFYYKQSYKLYRKAFKNIFIYLIFVFFSRKT